MCIIAGEEVGIDVQEHKKVNYERNAHQNGPGRHGTRDS